MKIEDKWLLIILGCLGIINLVITYFGRIYYPINFMPESTSFLENYLVLFFGEVFFGGFFVILVGIGIGIFLTND